MRLYLDDVRPAPEGWVLVKTAAECISFLKTFGVECLSLDHDLGDNVDTGYTVVCWMEENDIWPTHKPSVHSANPVGRARMQQVIDLNFPKGATNGRI